MPTPSRGRAMGPACVFSVTQVLSKDAEDAEKEEWKDVIRWREQERGDVLLSLPVAVAIRNSAKIPPPHQDPKPAADKPEYPEDATVLTTSLAADQGDRAFA